MMQLMELLFPIIRNSMQFCHCLSSGYHDYLSFAQDMHLVVSSISWLCRIFYSTYKKADVKFFPGLPQNLDKLNLQINQRRKKRVRILLLIIYI